MEWVASTLTPPPNLVYPALLKLMSTSRTPAVDLTDAPTDLKGLVRFGERLNLVSARVPSRSARAKILISHQQARCVHAGTGSGNAAGLGVQISVDSQRNIFGKKNIGFSV